MNNAPGGDVKRKLERLVERRVGQTVDFERLATFTLADLALNGIELEDIAAAIGADTALANAITSGSLNRVSIKELLAPASAPQTCSTKGCAEPSVAVVHSKPYCERHQPPPEDHWRAGEMRTEDGAALAGADAARAAIAAAATKP